jgi:hypothetical protein
MISADSPLLLLGCGILQPEIHHLINKNGWPLDTHFLDSALHIDFANLSQTLTMALATHQGRDIRVFYGACHPLMDSFLTAAGTRRTRGQNCVEILLGPQRFHQELEQGAFFLLEDWAKRWELIVAATFGPNPKVIREIYRGDRSYLLGITTPCSRDFSAEAEAAGQLVGLPLRWLDVSLDHLEAVLQEVIRPKERETSCPI